MIAGNIQINDIPNLKYKDFIVDLSGALKIKWKKKILNKIDNLLNTVIWKILIMKRIHLKQDHDELGYYGEGKNAMGGMAVGETRKPALHELKTASKINKK